MGIMLYNSFKIISPGGTGDPYLQPLENAIPAPASARRLFKRKLSLENLLILLKKLKVFCLYLNKKILFYYGLDDANSPIHEKMDFQNKLREIYSVPLP